MLKPDLSGVILEWDDAQGGATKAFTRDQPPHEAIIMTTLGWLIKENEIGVTIATEVYLEDGIEYFRGHTFVPHGMVRSVTPFKLTKIRKPKETLHVTSATPNPPLTPPPTSSEPGS